MIKKFLRGILHFFMPRRSMAQLIEHYRSQGMKIGENCYIGHNVFIGVNAVVLPGSTSETSASSARGPWSPKTSPREASPRAIRQG